MSTRRYSFEAIGTHWDIQINQALSDKAWTNLQEKIQQRIEVFDATYSRFRADSLVSQLAKEAGRYDLPTDGFRMLKLYKQLYDITDGHVTPLIGQVIADTGYDADYSLTAKPLQAPPQWADVITFDERSITMRTPALLDFGAAGKGCLVDLVSQLIEQAQVKHYTVNAGGDIVHRGVAGKPLPVGLENPLDTTEVIGIVELSDQSLCASAGSKRTWGDFHHIMNPRTLRPASGILATWVIADDTMTADGLATALFFCKPALLAKHFTFSYAVLHQDKQLEYSLNFPATVFGTTQ